jgi:Kef-type K+ transport system membrane component KefB
MNERSSGKWSNVIYMYVAALSGGILCLWAIAQYGQHFGRSDEAGHASALVMGERPSLLHEIVRGLGNNFGSPLGSIILQVLTILVASRLCGSVLRQLGQPRVVGEIIAGICLGPSLLKAAFPELHGLLFPEASLPGLFLISNFGLILFMFIVGLELDLQSLSAQAKSALLVSHLSIIVPFVLGAGLAVLLFDEFGPHGFGFLSFALFMGVSMSITAFPVLARIIQEQNLTRTNLGAVALTCAAIDDVTAWCILAVVVGIVQSHSSAGAYGVVSLALVYAGTAVFAVRPLLRMWLAPVISGASRIAPTKLGVVFMILLISCLLTESIGIHAMFGAFLAGTIMPEDGGFKARLVASIEDVSTLILLPVFFAFTGLRTEIGLLSDVHSWLIAGFVIAVAVIGKMGGSMVAARFTGFDWRESAGLGSLMNTRGLVELVVLNIGYEIGVLTPKIFTILVLMALVTTMMTGPLLRLLGIVGPDAARPINADPSSPVRWARNRSQSAPAE